MSQDKWERTYGAQCRDACKSIDELHDLFEEGYPIVAALIKADAEELTELESTYQTITGSDDYPDEMLRARVQLKEIKDEIGDSE